MPKVIEDLENKILEEAKKQIAENGVEELKIRNIASAMNIALGTIYNYLHSKDELISKIIINDWNDIYNDMKTELLQSNTVRDCMMAIVSKYNQFTIKYSKMLTSYHFEKQPTFDFSERHLCLVKTLSELLNVSLSNIGVVPHDDICWMFSELLIDVNNENKDFKPYIKYFESLIRLGDTNE